MPTITFFRQARNDGGVRTGIEVEGQTVLSRFEGEEADDPALQPRSRLPTRNAERVS